MPEADREAARSNGHLAAPGIGQRNGNANSDNDHAEQHQDSTTPTPRPHGGYDPSIHGSYDPTAPYALAAAQAEQAEVQAQSQAQVQAQAQAQAVAHADPSAAEDYAATGHFNRFTGRWQATALAPENHNDENKSRRQMNAFFDVERAANSHDGRSLRAERAGKKLTRGELKAFREKRKERKEEKRRAWLRD